MPLPARIGSPCRLVPGFLRLALFGLGHCRWREDSCASEARMFQESTGSDLQAELADQACRCAVVIAGPIDRIAWACV